jgi:hypothetical protein
MACSERTDLGLPLLTNTGLHTKLTKRFACVDPYQTLPDPVLAVRNPLVHLDWSTNCYHLPDLGLNLGQNTITNHYHRDGGLGIDVSVAGSVVATWAVW